MLGTKDNNICFNINPAIEFMSAIHNTAKRQELVNECKEHEIPLDEGVLYYIECMEGKISKFQRSELQYFYDYDVNTLHGIGNMIFWEVMRNYPSIYKVPEFIQKVQSLEEIEIASYIVKLALEQNNNNPIKEICHWEQTKTNLDEMRILIQHASISNDQLKEKIINCLENAYETKERYCLMLKQFYEKAYKSLEHELLDKSKVLQEEYKKIFNENPKKFIAQLLKTDYDNIMGNYIVHVSFIGYCIFEGWQCSKGDDMLFLIGGFRHKYYGDGYEKEKIQMLFKALSDKNRLDIIELLGERDWYVYELAERLGMSAANISYHLGLLYEFNIVKFQRNDHRVYYSLDRRKLKELFDNATKRLFNK